MEITGFDGQIEKVKQRLEQLEQAAHVQPGANPLLDEALEEITTLLGELGVSEEELNQQNEQLVEAHRLIELERTHYKELFEFTPDGYLVTDANTTIREANHAAATLLGMRLEFLIGKPLIVFIAGFEHEKFLGWLTRVGKSDRETLELTLQPRSGKPFLVELTVTAIKTRSEPVGLHWLVRNISQRKQVEAALRKSEAEKALILDSTSDMIVYYGLDLRILWANSASGASVGELPAALIGRYCYEIWHERDTPCEECPILRARDTRQPAEFEHNTPTGNVFYLRGYPVLDETGKVTAMIEFTQDITQRKMAEAALIKSEAALRASERMYRLLAENSEDVIWKLDLTSLRFTYISPSIFQMRGYSVEEASAQSLDQSLDPESLSLILRDIPERIERFNRGDENVRVDERIVRQPCKDGSWIDVEVVTTVLVDQNGRASEILGVSRNVTDRVQSERALQEERNFITAILDNAAIVVNVLDREGRIVLVNKYYEQVSGYSASELEGRLIWDITLPEDEAQALKPYFEGIWEGDFPKVINNHVLTRNGDAVPFEWINTIITDNLGKPRYSLGVGLGLTQRRKMEEQLRASLAEKEVLLREIHHRVKNNLEVVNSIAAMQTRRINDPVAKDSMRQLQERIRTISLVHESLYRSGNLAEIHAQPFLLKLTDNLFQAFGWPKLDLQVHVEDIIIPIDLAVPFGLIVTELVTNSMKHAFTNNLVDNTLSGDASKNMILVYLSSRDGQNFLEVSDNGMGLPEELDWQNTASLGLRLANRLADQLHGTLELERRDGTLFRLKFPG